MNFRKENDFVVAKFGGTSMGDCACMLRSAKVAIDQKAKVVVVSATSGTTNDLIELAQLAEKSTWVLAQGVLNKIKVRHLKMARELDLSLDKTELIHSLVEELESMSKGIHLLKDCSLKAMDSILSIGERLSSVLFNEAMAIVLKTEKSPLKTELFDARKVVVTDEQFSKARPLTDEIKKRADTELFYLKSEPKMIVTQGFIGSTLKGMTTTLGRGGSDYSAAILAEALGANILEIWTDVNGIATTDPRICKKAKPIPEISFKEASELATFGAKVLHPATLLPAVRASIPVFVGSSFSPSEGGTWVSENVHDSPLVRAIAKRTKQVLITLSTPEMLYTHGFLFQIFSIFNDHKVSVDAITTSEISVSMTLDGATLNNQALLQDLSAMAELTIEENVGLISLIGNNINHTPGLSKRIFELIPDINVRMICLGASKHNFCFLVEEKYCDEVINRLHEAFL